MPIYASVCLSVHCLSAVLTLTVIQVAERTHFRAYIAYSVVITAFVYPVVSYWGWNSEGFLVKGDKAGDNYHDFAGGGRLCWACRGYPRRPSQVSGHEFEGNVTATLLVVTPLGTLVLTLN